MSAAWSVTYETATLQKGAAPTKEEAERIAVNVHDSYVVKGMNPDALAWHVKQTAPACPHGHGAMVLKDRSTYSEHQCAKCFCAFVNLSPEARKRHDALNDPEVRRFVNEDHRRRGGVE